jgi:hypothetical protein
MHLAALSPLAFQPPHFLLAPFEGLHDGFLFGGAQSRERGRPSRRDGRCLDGDYQRGSRR